ncbi:MAG: Gfo/Idh/MocA family oxidoreductase [Opitutaceae bacterium]|nr:Gfo/Idh/MocA family oxidoreductase [Opitutaceae bacterium]
MIRLGVIGYGGRVHGMINTHFRKVDPELRVTGIIDPDEEQVRARLTECDKDAVFYKDLATMIRKGKLDALVIGTRCNLHSRYAVQAAQYDLPLFLEKPVAVNMRQATDLEKAFSKSRCSVVVSFPLRVSPLCELAREYIEEGAVDTPVHIAATNYVNYGTVYWEMPYRDYSITGGLFLQKATHDLDYMMYLMGEPIVRVSAMATRGHVFGGRKKSNLYCSKCSEEETCLESPGNRIRNETTGSTKDHLCVYGRDCGKAEDGTLNEDCSSALVEFSSGAHGIYTQVFFSRRDASTRGATISGYQGTVGFDWYSNELRRVRHHKPFSAVEKASGDASHFGGDIQLAYDFVGLIQGKRKSRTPIETGLQSVYACLAARESAEKGRFVKVRQVSL